MRKLKLVTILVTSLLLLTPLSTVAFASTELIDYTGMTSSEINTFIDICDEQGFTEITLRLRAMYDWRNEAPSASEVSKAKQIITVANAAGIEVNLDMHTWYTTWDNYFCDSAANNAANRVKYLNYVEAAIKAFYGYDIKAWMLLNEPQARKASASENEFILDIIARAKENTDRPVSVRFMGGYSPTTGHYSSAIDEACDFICRNTYWDPRNPSRSVYGTTEAKMNKVINYAKSVGKELWITEFGKSKSNAGNQAEYVKAFVEYALEKGIDRIFCWVSQPESGANENYNIFDGYTPNPAFYELAAFAGSSGSDTGDSTSQTDSSSGGSASDSTTGSSSDQSSDDSQTDSSSPDSRYSSWTSSYSKHSSWRSSYSRYSSWTSSYSRHRH